ncbi:hypothetical protein LCGC14_1056220 [marine sediment metagenome]|uniref:Uncharacterized protein n=1 Tax=marine sediment metagenome TaxID=412755 RepID=A0A0F9MS00_9ZZZZ
MICKVKLSIVTYEHVCGSVQLLKDVYNITHHGSCTELCKGVYRYGKSTLHAINVLKHCTSLDIKDLTVSSGCDIIDVYG